MPVKPAAVTAIHRTLCACPDVDHADPCRGCPRGHFPAYQICEGNEAPMAPRPQAHDARKPGDLLAIVIQKITGASPHGLCHCGNRIRQMNEGGWWWCWKNRKLIAGWLVEEARKRGHNVGEESALSLFLAALAELKRSS